MRDPSFDSLMEIDELAAWKSFKDVVTNFLGNNKALDYVNIVEKLIENYKNLGCLMNLKIHFLNSHLDYFPDNLGAESEEQGERFHLDMKIMEERYKGHWGASMMPDYCWCLTKDYPKTTQNRISRKRNFFAFD